MKRVITLIAVISSVLTMAQAPNLMSYQAVVRDGSSNLVVSSAVGMQISILQGSVSGTAVYEETHTPTSNANGLVSVEIGAGTVVSGDISTIDWSAGPYFLKTETDPTGGTTYTITGTTQLMSVPYALHAESATNISNDQVDDADADPANEIQDISLSGTDLSISSGSTVDLTVVQDGVDDADADPANEFNTGASLTTTTLNIVDGGGTQSVDLSSLQDGTGTDSQTLSFTSPNLTVSGGNTVDLSSLQDGTGTDSQTLSFTSPNLSVSGGNTVDLSALQDGVTDADADPANEIQNLDEVLTQGNDAGGNNIVNTGSVGVGIASPDASSALDVTSTTQGFLPPRMSDTQRDAIASPAAGLMIFNTTTGCMNYFDGFNWNQLCGEVPGSGSSMSTASTTCLQILTDFPASTDGVYWIDPDGAGANAPFECYCDMTTDGGGWTLVMNNGAGTTAPTPNYASATGITITTVGSITSDLSSFDMHVGLTHWSLIGSQLKTQVGTNPSTITNSATYDFALNAGNNYELTLSNESNLVGGTSPGIYTYHSGFMFSASDVDNDIQGAMSCSQNYGNTVWWYGACWSGNIWGYGGTDGPFWTGSSGPTPSNWGGIWVR
jgi:hypothetical protein